MRKIIVEFILPESDEEDYADVCSELVIEDFLGIPLRVLSDSGWPCEDDCSPDKDCPADKATKNNTSPNNEREVIVELDDGVVTTGHYFKDHDVWRVHGEYPTVIAWQDLPEKLRTI